MAAVRLKVNMIIDGVNYPVGSLFERSKIPSRLRWRENYEPAGATREEDVAETAGGAAATEAPPEDNAREP